jgi:hypothetical protein
MDANASLNHLFVFSHDVQILWYRVFAEAFRELRAENRVVIFVHGSRDAELARSLGCYDVVIDLVGGFRFDPTIADAVEIRPEIRIMEDRSSGPFFWDDIRTDRWLRADLRSGFATQYMNHVAWVITAHYEEMSPIAALGEYTMAAYKFAQRFFESKDRPMLWPIGTRYYERFYFETTRDWEWRSCIDLYKQYLENGIPPELESIARTVAERIGEKYGKPRYSQYQDQSATGYVQLHKLSVRAVRIKLLAAFRDSVRRPEVDNPRSIRERGVRQKVIRMVRERRSHLLYEHYTQKAVPDSADFGVYFFHYQPEYTSEGLGRFYRDQFFLIENIAAALPAGMRLVVKEHPTMVGLRSPDIYQRLRAIPNVILVSYTADSADLIKRCKIVFTIVGTPALEAMFIGKPAIMFGKYAFCETNLISFCSSFWSMGAQIKEKLCHQSTEADIARHAHALLAAKYAASYPGRLPIAVELVQEFMSDISNFETVKKSFQSEIERFLP